MGSSRLISEIREHHCTPAARLDLDLEDYQKLSKPITLDEIRGKAAEIQKLLVTLTKDVGKRLYFPFEIGSRRPMRPMQGYLFKLPVGFFFELFGLQLTPSNSSAIPSHKGVGAEYRSADETTSRTDVDPFAIDPALIERGVRGHAITQNGLARHLRSIGVEPRSPRRDERNFDAAWSTGGNVFVAEVKSLTIANEEKQLRLGLGQVLRFVHQLDSGSAIFPVLVVERRPTDARWEHLYQKLGVILAWPDVFAERIRPVLTL